MRWVFARLKLTKKVTRPRAVQASEEAQQAWKKKELREALQAAEAGLVWGGEMRVGLRGQVRLVWALRGVKVCQQQVGVKQVEHHPGPPSG